MVSSGSWSPCRRAPDETPNKLADGARTFREIVELSGGNHLIIDQRLRALGLRTRKVNRTISPESRRLTEEIARLVSEALTQYAVSTMLGVYPSGVRARYER